VGSGNLLMAYSHLGHNCELGDRIVIANGVAVAGHVVIGDRAVIGGVLGIHQFVHIGTLAMVGGMSRIERDVPPFTMVEGHPSRVRALNKIGLRRSGLVDLDEGRQFEELKHAWTLLYRRGLTLAEALGQLRAQPLDGAADQLCTFLEASLGPSRRGPIPGAR
jgi:UDP-N-acetylglucosamine acyltransferase